METRYQDRQSCHRVCYGDETVGCWLLKWNNGCITNDRAVVNPSNVHIQRRSAH
jgi:hypothetical protein